MKPNIFNYIALGIIALLAWSCEKDEIQAVLNPGAVPVVTVSAQSVVLTKENAAQNALTVSWAKPDYGFDAAAQYTLLMDKKGSNFSNAVAISTGTDLTKTFKVNELNPILIGMGLKPAEAADIEIKVQSAIGGSTVLSSVLSTVKMTPYLDKLDLSSTWGLVGSATPGSWNGPDVPFYKTEKSNVFVAYATLVDGEIKIRQDNKWDTNYGGTGGVLSLNGSNIAVKAGTYKVTFDLGALKYTVEKFSWGVVGSATPSGWAAPDVPFVYDPSSDQWRAIATLKAGEIKFRQNEDWAVNYGDTKADGVLEAGGDNIVVKAGIYLITVDFKTFKYTIEAFKVWGLVGSATPTGWNGPDAKFTPNFGKEGVWTLNNIKLVDGEIKFRQNDDWAVNLGDTKGDGILKAGGDNIVVKAGTYDIVLDLSVPSKQTFKLTKK